MNIKFLPHDAGNGAAAVIYVLAEKDSKGDVRAHVQVLRGNPKMVGQLIDSLDFVNRYSSCVVAYHVDDAPTDAEIEATLDDFERIAFAGLSPNQYTYAAVLHQEADGSKHIHIIIPRVELISGRSFNCAPPGWEKRFGLMRDAINLEKGWARPQDPRLARLVQPGPVGNFAAWKNGVDPRQQITEWLTAQVVSGQINDRQDVLAALETLGQINRRGKDYISIRVDDGAKPIRLKGLIYDEKFDGIAFRDASAASQRRPAGREKPDLIAAQAARERLGIVVSAIADYNESRYRIAPEIALVDAQIDAPVPALDAPVAPHVNSNFVHVDASQRESVQPFDVEPSRGSSDSETSANPAAGKDVLRDASGLVSVQKKGAINDGIREIADRAIEQAQRSARAAVQAIERCSNAASAAYKHVISACRRVDSVTPKLIANMTDELDRFKSEISLSDYAQNEFGYELVKKDSSKASLVLKCGGDKIIITRQLDGHDVYFSVGDERDNGSIIDFLQRRKSVNLGLVRKELRAWLPGSKRPSIKVPQRLPARAVAVEKDRSEVLRRWASMQPYAGSYLTDERCIDPQTIAAFDVRQDERGNACIAHRDGSGVLGWESKNKGFTGFAAGGQRNVSFSRLDDGPLKRLVVTEAAIDAMSWSQLKHQPGTGYISTGGTQLSQAQREQLTRMMAKHTVPVVLAMDNDTHDKHGVLIPFAQRPGEIMAAELAAMAPPGVQMLRDVPTIGKDWNEALQALKVREIVQKDQHAQKM